VAEALLVEWYRELPQVETGDDPDLWTNRMNDALRIFRRRIRKRYTEGSLQRLLSHSDVEIRRAGVLAIGLTGSIQSNADLARMLHDEDELVSQTASDSLWEIWFRGGPEEANLELHRVSRLPEAMQVIAGLDEIIREWPEFAEPYNQRAILFFQRGDYQRSVVDCERTLALNPHHFGAQAGMGQCYMKMRKYSAALRAFKLALEINPTLGHLNETIRALENAVDDS
jgi:tetratricopeptide (TPR) repeat protein